VPKFSADRNRLGPRDINYLQEDHARRKGAKTMSGGFFRDRRAFIVFLILILLLLGDE
jgi:hypothetical protein